MSTHTSHEQTSSSKNLNSFNLCDENEEEENEQVEIQLSNSNIIKINVFHFYKYSKLIKREFTSDVRDKIVHKLQELKDDFNIKDESIITFCELLKEKDTNISDDQYFDLCKLSETFEVNSLQKILKKYLKNHLDDSNFVINLMLNPESQNLEDRKILIQAEKHLCNVINSLLTNSNFEKLPISTIERILSKSDPKSFSNDLLYDFISKSIEERFVLLRYINLHKISDDRFDNLVTKYENEKTQHFF